MPIIQPPTAPTIVSMTQIEPPNVQAWNLPFRTVREGRVAAVNARGAIVGPWMTVGGAAESGGIAGAACDATLVFDAAGVDPVTGELVDGECLGGTATTRPLLQIEGQPPLINCHRIVEDFQLSDVYSSAGTLFEFCVLWNPPTPERLAATVSIFENYRVEYVPPVATEFVSGLIFESAGALPAGAYLVRIDLCGASPPLLRMPWDGFGAYEIVLPRASHTPNGPLVLTPPTQATFLMWGTGYGRSGTQGRSAWIDSAPRDGTFSAGELALLAWEPGMSACGVQSVAVATAIWARRDCTRTLHGDANCDGRIDNFDIDPFVAALTRESIAYRATGAALSCYALLNCWGDMNRSGQFDNFDIDSFVSCLLMPPATGAECP